LDVSLIESAGETIVQQCRIAVNLASKAGLIPLSTGWRDMIESRLDETKTPGIAPGVRKQAKV
jgi:hypothetical protein